MRVLATYVLWFLAPLLVVETVAFGGGLHGATACSRAHRDTMHTAAGVAAFVQTSIGANIDAAAPAKC